MNVDARRNNRLRMVRLFLLVVGYGVSACISPAQEPEPPAPVRHELEGSVDRMVHQMRAGIQESDAALEQLGARIPKLRERMTALAEKIKSIEAPEPETPEPDESPPRQVQYRPPMERLVQKDSINFLCEEGRVSLLDFKAVDKLVNGMKGQGKVRVDEELLGSDFRLEGHIVFKSGGKIGEMELTVVRRPGYPGESYEEIQRPNSRFQKAISSGGKPESHVVRFSVWPDSFEIFRQARALAWKAGYDVGWSPMEPGERTTLIRGPGAGQTVQ